MIYTIAITVTWVLLIFIVIGFTNGSASVLWWCNLKSNPCLRCTYLHEKVTQKLF